MTIVFSCKDEVAEREQSRAEKERQRKEDSAALKIAVVPTEDCLPMLVAKELRLYDTLGVDVRLKKYDALSACRHALEDSLVEGAAIDSTLMSIMNGDNHWLYAPMTTPLSWKMLTAKKARISRIAQMNDKMIAADGHGESRRLAENAIDSMLKKNQMVFVIQVEDPRIRCDMLSSGNVDAAMLPEPYASKALRSGAKVIESVKSKPVGVVAFRTNEMQREARKKQYKAFSKAVQMAKDTISKNGKEKYLMLLEW